MRNRHLFILNRKITFRIGNIIQNFMVVFFVWQCTELTKQKELLYSLSYYHIFLNIAGTIYFIYLFTAAENWCVLGKEM